MDLVIFLLDLAKSNEGHLFKLLLLTRRCEANSMFAEALVPSVPAALGED